MKFTLMIYLKIKRKIYYRQNIYLKNLVEFKSHGFTTTVKDKFKVVKVNESHIRLLKDYANMYRRKEHYEKNIKPRILESKRFTGIGVLDNNKQKIAYLAWIDFDRIELNDAEYFKKLEFNQAYFFDDHCVPEYRRNRLHKRVFEERISYCMGANTNEIFIAIMNDNKIAINNLNKFEFKLIKSISVYPLIRLLGSKQS